jgi:hypothetical protein
MIMKKTTLILTLLLMAGSFSTNLFAQTSLEALLKKCEAMTTIDMSLSRTRNAQTKELEQELISFTIRDNPALIGEFMSAFKKEEANAIQVSESRKGGQISSLYYIFENAIYSLSYKEEGKTVGITITRGSKAGNSLFTLSRSMLERGMTTRRDADGSNSVIIKTAPPKE